MNIYEYNGDGMALGTVIIILANNEEEARKLGEEKMYQMALRPFDIDRVRLVKENIEPHNPSVIWAWNGDY